MIDFILECYEEYKIFMDLKQNILPDIIPIMKTHPEDESGKYPFAYINEDEIGMNPINIYYDSRLSENRKDFIKAILFHEFTHIYDGITLQNKYSGQQWSALMHIYSEYHAAQIELACKVGFKNIHLFYKIDISKTQVPFKSKMHKIEDDYIYPMADSIVIIERPKEFYYDLPCDEYYKYYEIFESKLMYYLGKKNFCHKYSFKKLPDITQKSYGEFYPYINKIEECIRNKDFTNIVTYENELWNKFLNSFPLKEEELQLLLKLLE